MKTIPPVRRGRLNSGDGKPELRVVIVIALGCRPGPCRDIGTGIEYSRCRAEGLHFQRGH